MALTLIANGQEILLTDRAAVAAALIEHGSYRLRLCEERTEADLALYRASVGSVPLTPVRERQRGEHVELEWLWEPNFFAGHFRLQVTYDGRSLEADLPHTLHVSTPAAKLHAEAYWQMLTALATWTSSWQAPSPAHVQGQSRDGERSLLAQLAFLERRWGQVERLVEMALAHPQRELRQRAQSEPLARVRMLGRNALPRLLTSGGRWSAVDQERLAPLPALARLGERSGGLLPARLPVDQVYSTLESAANQFVATFLAEIRQRVPLMLELLKRRAGDQPGLVAAALELVSGIERRIAGWWRTTWVGEIRLAQGLIAPSNRVIMHPVYGSLWRLWREWQRPVVILDGGGQSVPLDRTYQLYEYWTFFKVAVLLARLVGAGSVLPGALRLVDGELRLPLAPNVRYELPITEELSLIYQPAYRYGSAGIRSISHEMRPDMAVRYRGRLLLLDAKYRVSHAGLTLALGDMHRYRDALVDELGRPAVAGGYLLVPGRPTEGPDGRYLTEEYHRAWRFGLCQVRPGAEPVELERVLREFLA